MPSPKSRLKGAEIPLVKIKRVGGLFRVYKWSPQAGNYKVKRSFVLKHQAHRYVKGFGQEAKLKVTAPPASQLKGGE